MTMSLVRGSNYGGVCHCSAISMLVREGVFACPFLNSESYGRVTIGLYSLNGRLSLPVCLTTFYIQCPLN